MSTSSPEPGRTGQSQDGNIRFQEVTERGYRELGGWWWVALLAIPLLLLCLTLVLSRPGIETDLEARTKEALENAGVSGADVSFSGRDGEISAGSSGMDHAKLEEIVTGVDGVRVASITGGTSADGGATDDATTDHDDDHAADGTETTGSDDDHGHDDDHSHGEGSDIGEFTVERENGKVTVKAKVPSDADKQKVLAAAKEAANGMEIVDKVTVSAGAKELDPGAVAQITKALTKNKAEGVRAVVGNGHIMLHGQVNNIQEQVHIETDAAYKGANVDNHMTADGAAKEKIDCEHANHDVELLLKAQEIRFVTGSATVDERSLDELHMIAELLSPCMAEAVGGSTVTISGHTDNVGDPAANVTLSEKRAQAVRKILVDEGMPADKLKARGYGAERPTADNNSSKGRAENRRVEIVMG